jgi:glycosyltransferase involved in cell wall biosynthesis
MRVLIIGNFTSHVDEGMMKVADQLGKNLSLKNSVRFVNARKNIFQPKFWKEVLALKPEVIHVFLRPSLTTFSIIQLLKIVSRNSKVLLSAVQPPAHSAFGIFFWIKPDLVLVQSSRTLQFFEVQGYKTSWLSNGVETGKFQPVSREEKANLRKKYSIAPDQFLVLHVGHITKGRNLGILGEIAKQKGTQVLVVASTLFEPDRETLETLAANGCTIWRKFFPNIQELYQIADCYVFPVYSSSNCIELPLSVMEAMSTNLPVVSTSFGGIPRIFKEGDGLTISHNADIVPTFNKLRTDLQNGGVTVNTRNKVMNLTWEKIGAELEQKYRSL